MPSRTLLTASTAGGYSASLGLWRKFSFEKPRIALRLPSG